MDPQEYSPIDTYRLKVVETHDHEIIEWSGSLTISAQDNSETFIDISFDDQPLFRQIESENGNSIDEGLSIECQAL